MSNRLNLKASIKVNLYFNLTWVLQENLFLLSYSDTFLKQEGISYF